MKKNRSFFEILMIVSLTLIPYLGLMWAIGGFNTFTVLIGVVIVFGLTQYIKANYEFK
jgi:multidrug efflux pump subunit AcrB